MADENTTVATEPDENAQQSDNDNEDFGGFDPEDAIVQIATRHGWKPKSELGNDDKWVPPDKYVDAQWDVNKAIRTGRERLENQVGQLTERLDKLMRQQQEVTKQSLDKMELDIKEQRKQAIEAGDVELVEQLDEQLQKVAEKAGVDDEPASNSDPAVDEWLQQSTWYKPFGKGADEDVKEIIELVEELNHLEEYKHLSPRFRLAKIDKEVADYVQMRRPDLIGKYHFNGISPVRDENGKVSLKGDENGEPEKGRKQISDVEGDVSRGGSRSKGKTYQSLSEMEQRACDVAVNSIQGLTREQWLKDYNAKFSERG